MRARHAFGRDAVAVRWIPRVLLPLIAVAEVFSWYTTLTSNFLGSVVEESIWALSATLVLCVLIGLRARSRGPQRRLHSVAAMLTAAYVAFMLLVDVPMYVGRWRAEIPWMTLYFSVGVWVSIALMRAPMLRERREAAPQ